MRSACLCMALIATVVGGTPAASASPEPLPRPPLAPPRAWQPPVPLIRTTASGVRVVVLPQKGLPLVHVRVLVRAASAQDPLDRPGLAAAVATSLLDGGAGTRSAPELAQAFEALGDQLSVRTERDVVSLSATVLASRLQALLGLVGDVLIRPRLAPDEWSRTRARIVAEIAHERDDPRFIAESVFRRVLYSDQHPYGQPIHGTPASVGGLEVGDLRRFYEAHYGPQTTTVIVVGDVAAKPATALVERALSGWRAKAALPSPLPPPLHVGTHLVLVDRPGAPQSELRIGHLGIARTSAEIPPARLLELVLGGSFTSRLVQNLRERHGYTYGARARFQAAEVAGPLLVQSAVRTDVTAAAIKEVVAELDAIMQPMSTAELSKGRALVRQQLVESFESMAGAAEQLGESSTYDLPLDQAARLLDSLVKWNETTLAGAAQGLFHPDQLVVVVVGDRKKIEPSLRALSLGAALEHYDVDGHRIAAP